MHALFKYLPAKFAWLMLNRGQVLIRPPRYFQELEDGPGARGDANESAVPVKLHVKDSYFMDHRPPEEREFCRSFQRFLLRGSPPGAMVEFSDCVLTETRVHPNVLLYCLSLDGSGALHRAFRSDTIIRILDNEQFTRLLGHALGERLQCDVQYEMFPCEYASLPVPPTSRFAKLPPYAVKDSAFSHQAEVRIVFKGMGKPLPTDEQLLEIPDLRSVITLHSSLRSEPKMLARSVRRELSLGPNDRCPCGSKQKRKRCCGL